MTKAKLPPQLVGVLSGGRCRENRIQFAGGDLAQQRLQRRPRHSTEEPSHADRRGRLVGRGCFVPLGLNPYHERAMVDPAEFSSQQQILNAQR